jgi:hypothetical protein
MAGTNPLDGLDVYGNFDPKTCFAQMLRLLGPMPMKSRVRQPRKSRALVHWRKFGEQEQKKFG